MESLYPTEVLVLGSATSKGVPEIGCTCPVCLSANSKDKRLRASILLRSPHKTVLVDCGPDFRQQMLTHNITDIDGVIITHEHYDHIGGLDDIRPFGHTDLYTSTQVQNVIRKNMPYSFTHNQHDLSLPEIALHEVKNNPFYIGNWQFQPIRLLHYKLPVIGLRIHNFAYLTDLSYMPDEEYEKLQNLDVLIIEALRITTHPSHINLQQALDIINLLKPKKAYLTHISHELGLHDEVQRHLPQNVFLAYDGLSIPLP